MLRNGCRVTFTTWPTRMTASNDTERAFWRDRNERTASAAAKPLNELEMG
jgi:hypothetical protein